MSNVNYTMTPNTLVVSFQRTKDGKTFGVIKTASAGSAEFEEAKKLLREGRKDEVPGVFLRKEMEQEEAVRKAKEEAEAAAAKAKNPFSDSFIEARDGFVFIDGKQVTPELSTRLLSHAREGFPIAPLVNFHRNLQQNPSYRAVQGLFRFLDANHFCFTEEGNFVAYKGISSDDKDLHTGKISNAIGETVTMQRNECNEDPEQTCSYGLHVASFNFAHQYYGGQKVVEVEVNPMHVVAVPHDYNSQKMRVCQYKVIGLSESERTEQVYQAPAPSGYNDYEEDKDEDDDEDECVECGYTLDNCNCD